MKILISTGIFPPDIGGPAQYAQNLYNEWIKGGNEVYVKSFGIERKLPTGFRHLFYFFKVIPDIIKSDMILSLDTFSVGWPTLLATRILRGLKISHAKFFIRTGGDFLWESYVERTGDMVLFKDFYNKSKDKLNIKERLIFKATKYVLKHADCIIFSTEWQRGIFIEAYKLDKNKTKVVENFYHIGDIYNINADKTPTQDYSGQKVFIGSTRNLKWKNIEFLKEVFNRPDVKATGATLFLKNEPYDDFMKTMKSAYATILVSLGDISPNMILDSIRVGKPFILTEENGLSHRLSAFHHLFINPKDQKQIAERIIWLCNEMNYRSVKDLISSFHYIHSWEDISLDILNIFNSIKD